MAPRTAKAKKAAEASEALKKGRGKAKNIEEVEPEADEQDIDEKVAPVVEKKKRGKKAAGDTNGVEENGKDDSAPLAKKERKKIEEPLSEEKQDSNDDQSVEEETPEQEDIVATNGDKKETETSGKGRKKQGKKEVAEKPKEAKSGRSRKPKKDEEEEADEEKSENGDKEEEEQKPMPAARGRGRKAQPKPEIEDKDEDAKPEPAARGRRKAQPKATKEKTPESDKEIEEEEEEKKTQPKKKETKGRKGKKVQAKEDSEEREEEPAEELPAAKKRKVTKKEQKGQGDTKDEDVVEEEQPEPKAKGKRGQKKAVEDKKTVEDDVAEVADSTAKRRRKPVEDKAPADDKKKPAPKNKAVTNYEELDFSNRSKTTDGKDWNFKIVSWNVDGIRAWMSKGGLDYLTHEKPDILCLQETKCSTDKLPEELANVPGYHAYWLGSDQDGYAGVGIYTTQLAMNVVYGLQDEELDNEGRIITAEYEQFYLICTYVPNAGRKLVTLPKRLQWNEEFRKYVKELDKKKPVIICGDMNVSHNEIDLTNPKTNRKNAGFTDEERAGMSDLLGDGFVDTYRHLYPDKTGVYTFWTYMMNCRAKNVGWRLDYFIVSERLLPTVCDNVIRSEVYGSDHCPISLFLHLKGADKPKE